MKKENSFAKVKNLNQETAAVQVAATGTILPSELEAIKQAYTAKGAYWMADQNVKINLAMQYSLITDTKDSEVYKKMGYPNFGEFASKVLDISASKANEILNLRKTLTDSFMKNAARLNLQRKNLLLFRDAFKSGELEIIPESDPEKPPVVIYNDQEIPVDSKNYQRLQDIARELEDKHKENANLKKKVGELKRDLKDMETFQEAMKEVETTMYSLYTPLTQFKQAAMENPELLDILRAKVIAMTEWIQSLANNILDIGDLPGDVEYIEPGGPVEAADVNGLTIGG